MNTRSSELQSAGVEIHTFYPVGTWSPPDPEPMSFPYARPQIQGVFEAYTGPNPSDGATWTQFEHYTRSMGAIGNSTYDLPWVSAWPNTGDRYWLCRFPTYFGWAQHSGLGSVLGTQVLFDPQSTGWFVPIPNNLEDLKRRALASIMPGVKAEMSLLNSIIELKDFRGVAKKAVSAVRRFRDLTAHLPRRFWGRGVLGDLKNGWQSYLGHLKKMSRGQMAMHVAGNASGTYLQWKFAIAPLIADVQAAMRALRTLEKRLNRLITNEGRVRTGHWSTTFEMFAPQVRSSSYSLGPPLYQSITASSEIQSSIGAVETLFHCEVRYNYNLTNYQREHARMMSYLDAFGLSFNPAIIWNAIPFTFVLDWVLGVSHYLEQFDVGNMDPKINILGGLWSVKHHRITTWDKVHTSFEGVQLTERLSMPSVTEDAYARHLFAPGMSSLQASGLTPSEVTLGAALVTAIAHRKARRKK